MLVRPAFSAFSLATAIMPGPRSVAMTWPSGPTISASVRGGSHVPLAMSRTCIRGSTCAARTRASLASALATAILECHLLQAATVLGSVHSWRTLSLNCSVLGGFAALIRFHSLYPQQVD